MTTFCFDALTALLPTYCLKRGRMKEEGKETLLRKRKVLHLLSQWIVLCRNTLQEGENTKLFLKVGSINVVNQTMQKCHSSQGLESVMPDDVPETRDVWLMRGGVAGM